METQKLTPLMQQYWTIKSKNSDKIVMFRMGDFYEMFYDDAVHASKVLGIALTARNKSQGNDTPMCGVPHHALGNYIQKLTDANFKVAIVEQLEDPAVAKGIVKRDVVRVVTPGMIYDSSTLDQSKSHFLAAVRKSGAEIFELALSDISTGEIKLFKSLSSLQVYDTLQAFEVREVVHPSAVSLNFRIPASVLESAQVAIEDYLLDYITATQGAQAASTMRPAEMANPTALKLTAQTLTGLEIFKTSSGETDGSLFSCVNRTKTPMGARLLRSRLTTPFGTLDEIKLEQSAVQRFVIDRDLASDVRRELSEIGDLERRIGRLSSPLCNARDLRALAQSLKGAWNVSERVGLKFECKIQILSEKILNTLKPDLPHGIKEGNLIEVGIHPQLDEYVLLATNAQTTLSELEARERDKAGIQSLKIKYNNVFGYFFEITKANLDKVPEHFIRKQTLASAERFVTKELTELEGKILSSRQKRFDLEFEIFSELKNEALNLVSAFQKLALWVAQVDLQASWAELAFIQRYVAPEFKAAGLVIKESRHPVIEQISRDPFIPNDVTLSQGHCLLLTGPNMAGKSTLMRQVAITIILAQCGAFVPATQAQLSLFDAIHTRIGASDNLSQGLSTFMVEMTETANIISSATRNSLVLLDEIGRGTSTLDGMSLAQAILEHFVDSVQAYTLFATHYHELTVLGEDRSNIDNCHMAIEESQGELVFLRKLVKGPAKGSYGIEVASLSGIPKSVTRRAAQLLKSLSRQSGQSQTKQLSLLEMTQGTESLMNSQNKVSEELMALQAVVRELKSVRVETLTPLEALNVLSRFQTQAEKILN